MKLFGITREDEFEEYLKTEFQSQHIEAILEDWLERNPQSILEDGRLLVIGRQVTTNLGSVIDLLGIDRQGDLVVIELKRGKTPRETLAQVLEYASFVEQLDYDQIQGIYQTYLDDDMNLVETHRAFYALSGEEALTFNKDQRIVIVGQSITPEIRQTAKFLRHKGLRATCVEFSFFKTGEGRRLLSADIVVGEELSRPAHISSGSLPKTNEHKFMEDVDNFGRPIFTELLDKAKQAHHSIHWGTKGFSLNINKNGVHVPYCFGYPPTYSSGQSLLTSLAGKGGMLGKMAIIGEDLQPLFSEALQSGLFVPSGQDLRCKIDRPLSDSEVAFLMSFYERFAKIIQDHPLKEEF